MKNLIVIQNNKYSIHKFYLLIFLAPALQTFKIIKFLTFTKFTITQLALKFNNFFIFNPLHRIKILETKKIHSGIWNMTGEVRIYLPYQYPITMAINLAIFPRDYTPYTYRLLFITVTSWRLIVVLMAAK